MRKFVRLWGFDSEDRLKGLSILDVGCGTGEKSVYLASLGARVTAVDVSREQLARARELARQHNVDARIDFACADVLGLSLKKEFDLALCSGVLHHTSDPQLGFANVAKHLKQDGSIIIGLYNKYSRVHYRAIRWVLHKVCGKNNPERIMRLVSNLPFNGSASPQALYDRYAVPYESYHSLGEVRRLFNENGIEVIGISPKIFFGSDLLSQLAWLAMGKSFFLVSGKKL